MRRGGINKKEASYTGKNYGEDSRMSYILQLPSGVTGQTLEGAYAGKGYTVPGATGTQCVSFLKATIPALAGKRRKCG